MAKPKLKKKARKLRRQGLSLSEIVNRISVSKSSVSLWCRDISLTDDQIKRLDSKIKKGGMKGRLKGAKMNREKRLNKIKNYKLKGKEYYSNFSEREFMAAGLALYLGEGSKTNRKFGFSNSNYKIIKFIKIWAKEIFGVKEKDFVYCVYINHIHKKREKEVLSFWSNKLEASLDNFRNVVYIKTKNKKKYENFSNHYGTMRLRIKKSSDIFYKIKGFSESLLGSKVD